MGETDALVTVDSFQWTVYDLDERSFTPDECPHCIKEKFIFDTSQAADFTMTNDTEIQLFCESFELWPRKSLDADPPSPHLNCPPGDRTVFHSSTVGTLQDNPTNKDDMTRQQLRRSVQFTFMDTSCFSFTYNHYCPPDEAGVSRNCQWYGSGNFLFAGAAKQLIEEGECITSSPTTSPAPTKNPTVSPAPTKNPTVSPTTSAPTGEPTKTPTVSPTPSPTVVPTKAPSKNPTASPTKTPTGGPTKNPTSAPTRTPISETTQPPIVEIVTPPPRECIDDGVIVKRIDGATEFPTIPTKPVSIVNVGKDGDGRSTVTVVSNQFWNDSSSVDHVFASYKETLYDEVCIEDQDVAGGGMIFDHTITIQCNIMSPWASLKICVVDDLTKNVLTNEDNAEIPKCCYPDIPDGHGTVCYNLQISCSSECVDVVEEERRMLRARN